MTVLGPGDPGVELPAVDLSRRILAIHATLDQLPGLEPGPVVNEAFAELVRICEYRDGDHADQVLSDPRIVALTPRLRQLCALGEFRLERSWAQRIIRAADPEAELAGFPYRANYEQLTRLEVHAMAGVGLDLGRVRRVCFLGGGPLPLSALLMNRALAAPVDVIDVDGEATALAARVAERVAQPGQVHVHHTDAADFDGVADSDVVVLAALVGLERAAKRRVLAALAARMRRGSMLVVRSSHRLRTLLYPAVELSDLHEWQLLSVVHPLNAVVNSVLVATRR